MKAYTIIEKKYTEEEIVDMNFPVGFTGYNSTIDGWTVTSEGFSLNGTFEGSAYNRLSQHDSYLHIYRDTPFIVSTFNVRDGGAQGSSSCMSYFEVYTVDDEGNETFIVKGTGYAERVWTNITVNCGNVETKHLKVHLWGNTGTAASAVTLLGIKGQKVIPGGREYEVKHTKLTKDTVRKYYKYGTTPNITVIGSPSINDWVISGFSTSNYATLPNSIDASVFEIKLKIKTSLNTASGGQKIFAIGSQAEEGKALGIFISNNGTIMYIKHYNNATINLGQIDISNNTDYYIKIISDGSNITSYINQSGFSSMTELAATTLTQSLRGTVYLGYEPYNTAKGSFKGSIDLLESNINVNNNDWWHGTIAEESTESDYDFYKDINTYKAIKSYEKGQYYGN